MRTRRTARPRAGHAAGGPRQRRSRARPSAAHPDSVIRYAVVGLGHIAQAAVLPAFRHAGVNSALAAVVSGHAAKRRELARRYGVRAYPYEEYDALMRSGLVRAVYLALPNHLHAEYAERAAAAGVHVLCEKPMAVTEEECRRMITACRAGRVKLMIAYRLHFERANLTAVDHVQRGDLGEPRLFQGILAMRVKPGDIRLMRETGGGPLYDIGVYCINAARYVFREEPREVMAFTESGADPRFREVPESVGGVLRFPHGRLASFACSFGSADASAYEVLGTTGSVRVDPAFGYAGALTLTVTRDGRTQSRTYPKRDQFAAELVYFSDCVLRNRDPEPSGEEGLTDVRIIQALRESARTRSAVTLSGLRDGAHPTLAQEIRRPPVEEPEPVHARSPRD